MHPLSLRGKLIKMYIGEENDDLKRMIEGYENIITHRKNECIKREKSINAYVKNINDLNMSIKISNQNALTKHTSNNIEKSMNKTTYKKFCISKNNNKNNNKNNINKFNEKKSSIHVLKEKLTSYSLKNTKCINSNHNSINTNKKNISPIRKLFKNTNNKKCNNKNNKIYLKTDSNFFKSKINKKIQNHINDAKIHKIESYSTSRKAEKSLDSINNRCQSINKLKILSIYNKNNNDIKNNQNEKDKLNINHNLKKDIKNKLKNYNKEKIYKNVLNNKDLKILYNIDKNKINKMIECRSNDNKMKMDLKEYQKNLLKNDSSFITKNNRRFLLRSFQYLYDNFHLKSKRELIPDYINRVQNEEFDIINKNNKDNENLINKFLEIGISPNKFDIKIDRIECQNVLINK